MTVRNQTAEHGMREQDAAVLPTITSRSRVGALLDMSMLYASKTGSILVGVFILPQFSHLLGADQFGVVAVIFSFQALLLMLDLGMSTLVGRDIAAFGSRSSEAITSWRTAETVISAFYLVLLPLALVSLRLIDINLSSLQVLATLLLFWALTLQNIGQAALLAKHHFIDAGSIQVVGVATRAVVTLLALNFIAANLTVFLVAQVACALTQLIATHIRCTQLLREPGSPGVRFHPSLAHCIAMARRGQPLVLFGIAGATVMQLDKPIVSAFASAAELAPYYLATIFCLTPLSILAGPVAQFFQPRLVRAISSGDTTAAKQVLAPFVTAIVLFTFLPSALLWLLRTPILAVWLGSSAHVDTVAHFVGILLPGVAIGALGYVPYVILVARQDYKFQARASIAMSVLTLLAATWFAYAKSVEGVCWVYAVYHGVSTLVSWARCIYDKQGIVSYASGAALQILTMVAVISLAAVAIAICTILI